MKLIRIKTWDHVQQIFDISYCRILTELVILCLT
jgi:hypothetical protein